MNANLIAKRLAELNSQTKGSGDRNKDNIFWKPEPGNNLIRILPNPYNREYPFSEFFFYYDFGKTMISPKSFGKHDPIVEFAKTLRASKVPEDFKLALSIEPKPRTYAAILVRGKEHEGPKLWGFGKTVLIDLLGFMADPDYGDITDLVSGRDITVEYMPNPDPKQSKTNIRVKPNVSKAFDSEEVAKKVQEMPNPQTVWKEPTEDDLKAALEKYLNGAGDQEPVQEEVVPRDRKEEANPSSVNVQDVKVNVPTDGPSKLTDEVLDNIDKMFDDLPF